METGRSVTSIIRLIETAGDDLFFQTTSRTGVAVDSGVIHRTIRPASGGVAHQ
jgi:hypothetical protein